MKSIPLYERLHKRLLITIVIVLCIALADLVAQPFYRQGDYSGKDVYADAPWRMEKTDSSGNLRSLPVHIFIHDADILGSNAELINIDIRIKNADNATFGSPVTFDTYSDSAFLALFSCKSATDAAMGIQSFDASLPVKSNSTTISFTQFNCSWPDVCTYTDITESYWYFTINVPPDKLMGYSDIIDIEVHFNLNWETDEVVRLRVFRSRQALPGMAGWYRGDTHFHSMFTTNEAEFGLPLCACGEAARAVGIDWITVTDHSCDYDNYGVSMRTNWTREGNEIAGLNAADTSFVFIRALEASCQNARGDVIHLLNYPSPGNPLFMPFIGDGGGDISSTQNTITDYLLNLSQINGFAYAAHPFAEGDELSSLIGGGIWNIADPGFYLNGSQIPAAGNVISNDTTSPSDFLHTADSLLLKEALLGGEIWNAYYNLSTTDEYTDPWDVTYDGSVTPFSPLAANHIQNHIYRFRHGLAAADFFNQKGLAIKAQYPQTENYRFFISAGTDAHGSFNYSNTDYVMGISGFIDDNAIGKMSTLVYCPQGMGSDGTEVLDAMQSGNMILSDGPVLFCGIDINNDGHADLIPGQDSLLTTTDFSNARILLQALSDSSFGVNDSLTLVLGTASELSSIKLDLPGGYSSNFSYDLDSVFNICFGPDSLMAGEYMFVRAELKTRKYYGSQGVIYCTNQQDFHSFTNPIWIGRNGTITATENTSKIDVLKIYPVPAVNDLFIQIPDYQGAALIAVFDIRGRLILKKSVFSSAGSLYLPVSNLESGIYFLSVTTSQGNFQGRFLK